MNKDTYFGKGFVDGEIVQVCDNSHGIFEPGSLVICLEPESNYHNLMFKLISGKLLYDNQSQVNNVGFLNINNICKLPRLSYDRMVTTYISIESDKYLAYVELLDKLGFKWGDNKEFICEYFLNNEKGEIGVDKEGYVGTTTFNYCSKFNFSEFNNNFIKENCITMRKFIDAGFRVHKGDIILTKSNTVGFPSDTNGWKENCDHGNVYDDTYIIYSSDLENNQTNHRGDHTHNHSNLEDRNNTKNLSLEIPYEEYTGGTPDLVSNYEGIGVVDGVLYSSGIYKFHDGEPQGSVIGKLTGVNEEFKYAFERDHNEWYAYCVPIKNTDLGININITKKYDNSIPKDI